MELLCAKILLKSIAENNVEHRIKYDNMILDFKLYDS